MPVKYFVIFSLLLSVLNCRSFADIYLRDVPEGHYAYEAIYDLIRRGVTGGFPDGTFRGKKTMSRYEVAAFLSKLAKSFDVEHGINEKLAEELRSEVSLLQYEMDREEKATRVSGEIRGRAGEAQANGLRGVRLDYRLISSLTKSFDENSSLRMNLDTMDSGFNGGIRDLVRQILDVEIKAKAGRFNLKGTAGSGDVSKANDSLFPIEKGFRYRRPRRTFSISTNLAQAALSIEYLARSADASGLLSVAELSPKLSQDFALLKLTLNPRIFLNNSGDKDYRMELSGEIKSLGLGLLVGAAKTAGDPHGLYLRGEWSLAERAKVLVQKIGSQYRQNFTAYGIFDLFDRALSDGSTNLGAELLYPFNAGWFIKAKGDYTDPGSIFSAEMRLGYNISSRSTLSWVYQFYRAASSSQTLGLEGSLQF